MSTRKRSTLSDSKTPLKSYLPPAWKGNGTPQQKTTLPLSSLRFSTFVYVLSALSLAFITFNAWRMLQLKNASGGWWNLALGRRIHDGAATQPHGYNVAGDREGENGGGDSVEDRINALAEALGIPPHELASAIAVAVKSHIPPASLSSISTAAEATHSGTVKVIMGGEQDEGMQGGVGRMGETLSAIAGFDDPDMV